jgi:hypothetical protein
MLQCTMLRARRNPDLQVFIATSCRLLRPRANVGTKCIKVAQNGFRRFGEADTAVHRYPA